MNQKTLVILIARSCKLFIYIFYSNVVGQLAISSNHQQTTVSDSMSSSSFSVYNIVGQPSPVGLLQSKSFSLISGSLQNKQPDNIEITSSSNFIDFEYVQLNSSLSKKVTLYNFNEFDSKIKSVITTNPSFTLNFIDSLISAFDSIVIYIDFTPTLESKSTGNLNIKVSAVDDDSNNKDVSIDLVGTGFLYSKDIVLKESISFINTETTSSYKMIGIPGQNDLSISDVLKGNPGKENDWRAFFDQGSGEYLEYNLSSIFNFRPGNGFWVLSKNSFKLDRTVQSVPLNEKNVYSISLHAGWNIISNPFLKEVNWSDVKETNGLENDGAVIEYFKNGRYISPRPTSLEAYNGYYFFNNPVYNLDSLKIPYISSNTVPKKSWIEENTKGIGIKLVEGNKEIGKVFVGYLEEGKEGLDRYDEYSPPGEFERKSIKIRNDKLETEYKYLRKDYRKEIGGGQKYEIDIKIDPDKKMKLRAIGGKEYGDYKLYLVDERLKNIYDLTRENEIEISTNHKFNQYEFLVGTEEYVKARTENLVPKEIKLYQNYPNPFNPRTIIRFSLPEESRVTLLVYNLLGELVKTLLNNQVYRVGYHEVVWDASIETSGIYFYKLNIGNYILVKKMILMK